MTYEFNLYPPGTEAIARSQSRISVCTEAADRNPRYIWDAGTQDFSLSASVFDLAADNSGCYHFHQYSCEQNYQKTDWRSITAPGICRLNRSMVLSKGSVQSLLNFVVSLLKLQLLVLVECRCARLRLSYVYILTALTPFM
jgi:hypothetical protein